MNQDMNIIVANTAIEMLLTQFGDEIISLSTTVVNGLVVGVCSTLGGLLGGRYGILVGGSIGSLINTHINRNIITIREVIQRIDFTQLQSLLIQIFNEIKHVVKNTLNRIIDSTMNVVDLLIMFGTNSEVRTRVIQIFTVFYNEYQNVPQIRA